TAARQRRRPGGEIVGEEVSSRTLRSLDHLVGAGGEHGRNFNSERPLTDHDLARFCLVAEPRCKVAVYSRRCSNPTWPVARSDPNSAPKNLPSSSARSRCATSRFRADFSTTT